MNKTAESNNNGQIGGELDVGRYKVCSLRVAIIKVVNVASIIIRVLTADLEQHFT